MSISERGRSQLLLLQGERADRGLTVTDLLEPEECLVARLSDCDSWHLSVSI